MFTSSKVRGFTLIELMIAIAIIFVMLSILAAAFFEARQNSRDRTRVSDLTQIQFAIAAYSETNSSYPVPDTPQEIQHGYIRVLKGTVNNYWDTDVQDPRWDPSGTYEYRIYPELECGEDFYYAVVASNMEVEKNSNGAEICPGNTVMDNAYVVFVAGPIIPSSSINYNIEDGDGTEWWNEPDNQTWLNDDSSAEAPPGG